MVATPAMWAALAARSDFILRLIVNFDDIDLRCRCRRSRGGFLLRLNERLEVVPRLINDLTDLLRWWWLCDTIHNDDLSFLRALNAPLRDVS
jgi:hypothetical protein